MSENENQLTQQLRDASILKLILTEEQLVLLAQLDIDARVAAAKYSGAVTAVLRDKLSAADAEGTWALVGQALVRQPIDCNRDRNGGR